MYVVLVSSIATLAKRNNAELFDGIDVLILIVLLYFLLSLSIQFVVYIQVVVLEIAECTKMKIQQNGHDFTVGQRRLAMSTLDSTIVFKSISCIFRIKMLAKLVYYTKQFCNFVIGSHIKCFVKKMIFTYEDTKYL